MSPGLLLCKSYSLRVAIWPARAFRSACFTRQPTWILLLPLHRHSLREGMEGCTLNTAVWCSSSESLPLSQPRRTLCRARQHTHVPHPITPLPPASFVWPYGCGGGLWAGALAPYKPYWGVDLSPNACHPNHNLAFTFEQVWVCGL